MRFPAGVTSSGEIAIGGGDLEVTSGGAIVGTIVTQTGGALVGGTAIGTTVQGNNLSSGDNPGSGRQVVFGGVAISTLIASGGEEAVIEGGVTSGGLVPKGGVEFLGGFGFGSGLAVGMTVGWQNEPKVRAGLRPLLGRRGVHRRERGRTGLSGYESGNKKVWVRKLQAGRLVGVTAA